MWTIRTKPLHAFQLPVGRTGLVGFAQQPSVEDVMLYYGYDPESTRALVGEEELALDHMLDDQDYIVFAPLNYRQIWTDMKAQDHLDFESCLAAREKVGVDWFKHPTYGHV